MDEENKTKTENKKPEDAPANADEGSKYETTPVIERAREEREKLDAANDRKEKLLDREEQIMAKRMLGGTADAGQQPVKKSEDQKKVEQATDFFKGSQLELDIAKANK